MNMLSGRAGKLMAAVLVVGAAVIAGVAWRVDIDDQQALASQARTIAQLETQTQILEARASGEPDWPTLAASVAPSVVTIETDVALGSGWIVRSDAAGSDIITNLHVVEDAVSAGISTVEVRHGDDMAKGTIVHTDRSDDLAVVHVQQRFAPLKTARERPRLGTTVMVVGSPLGLEGTVSVGIVSGTRVIDGSDYVQFSAPISPGNSGGPVVDASGTVVAIATAKLVGDGVEGLGFGIPIQVACRALQVCAQP